MQLHTALLPVGHKERYPVYRAPENESDKARRIAFFIQRTTISGVEVPFTPDEFGNQPLVGSKPVDMSLDEYRIHLAKQARMKVMTQEQVDWLHPGQQWELGAGRAYSLRYLIKFVIDLIGDDHPDLPVRRTQTG